ncbi:MAG TPA: hypothetical protein PKI11_21695, partial [Candidatus Hydrogenedentes bacterium]|nr:hypothetical protein [Candidatus Hydrogenedentota bacterium]
ACVLLAVAAWYVPARMLAAETAEQAVTSGMGGNLFRNIVGRLFLGVSKAQPPWYYATTIPVDLLPWTLLLPWAAPWIWRRRGADKAMRFLWCGTAPALVFFSISVGKRAVYILPLFPLVAVLLAVAALDLADRGPARWRRWMGAAWGLILLVVAAGPLILRFTEYSHFANEPLLEFAVLAGACGAAALGLSLFTRMARLHVVFAATFAALALAAVWAVFPLVNTLKSARSFCEPVRILAEQGAAFRLYSVGFSREEYVYYSRRPHTEAFASLIGEVPTDMDELMAVADAQKRARKLIAEAVADVAIADIAAVTEAEREALWRAIEDAVDDADEEVQGLRAFEHDLIAEVDAFAALFAVPEPVFVFVQEEDWRWLLPLFTTVPPYHVVRHQGVGRREVLLLANDSGRRLLGPGMD